MAHRYMGGPGACLGIITAHRANKCSGVAGETGWYRGNFRPKSGWKFFVLDLERSQFPRTSLLLGRT